jgi:hypothetical protein
LTTNRVGTIDEAFKSRIHVSLYYPPLDERQTLDIFKVNLGRLHEIEEAKRASRPGHTALEIDDDSILEFAMDHYHTHKQPQRWNGRQIRNAFQVAYSLAQFSLWNKNPDDSDDEDQGVAHTITGTPGQLGNGDTSTKAWAGGARLRLDSKQFNTVSQSIEKFDAYLFKTRGDDAKTAKDHQIRNDYYQDPREVSNRRSVGPDYYRTGQRLHPRSRDLDGMPRGSPAGRGSMFDSAAGRSPRLVSRDALGLDDEDEEGKEDNADLSGPDYEKYKNIQVRKGFPSSYSSPAVPRASSRRGQGDDRHSYYGQRGDRDGVDDFSPDDTGYGRGGSMGSGRASSYGRGGGYEY